MPSIDRRNRWARARAFIAVPFNTALARVEQIRAAAGIDLITPCPEVLREVMSIVYEGVKAREPVPRDLRHRRDWSRGQGRHALTDQ